MRSPLFSTQKLNEKQNTNWDTTDGDREARESEVNNKEKLPKYTDINTDNHLFLSQKVINEQLWYRIEYETSIDISHVFYSVYLADWMICKYRQP